MAKVVRITIRIDPKVHKELVRKAKEDGRSLNGMIGKILSESVGK